MNKAKIKNLLVDKGEKYGLIAAGGLMLLFLILGVSELMGSPNPDDLAKEMEKNTAVVKSTIDSKVDQKAIPPLPPYLVSLQKPQQYTKDRWPNNLFFDPFNVPDLRAINPNVLALSDDTQADLIGAKIYAYDIREGPDGQLLIGVIKKTKIDKAGEKENTHLLNELKRLNGNIRIPQRPNPQAGGAGPGGAGPGQVRPPAGPGERPAVKNGGPGGAGGALVNEGERLDITYIPLDPEKGLQGFREALTIYPQRMVIIQAALPYQAQIEEIQKALRLQDPLDVLNIYKDKGEEVPLFRGFAVQRQVLALDGKTIEEPWRDLNVLSYFQNTIMPRKYLYRPEDPKTNYVLLHKGHELVMHLPILLNDLYPKIRIKPITDTINAQVKLNTPTEAPKTPSQFSKERSVFDDDVPTSTNGQPNLNLPRGPAVREGDPKAGTTQVAFKDMPEFKLVRIIDNDIVPGRSLPIPRQNLHAEPELGGPRRTRTASPPTSPNETRFRGRRTPTLKSSKAIGLRSRIASAFPARTSCLQSTRLRTRRTRNTRSRR